MIQIADYDYWVALGALFLQCVTAYLFVEHFFLKGKYLSPYVRRFGFAMLCIVGVISAALSLTYSEVYGFVPCGLCWIERGLLYSISLISGMALWKKYMRTLDTSIADYGIGLSLIGAVISFYHHYGQMSGGRFVVCPTAGIGADCARRLVFEFGYITLPLMAFTAFAFFVAVFLIYRRKNT
jgi:disulfide bond formation protein DsbB